MNEATCVAVVHETGTRSRRCGGLPVAIVHREGQHLEHLACARHLDLALSAGWSARPVAGASLRVRGEL